MQCRGAKRANQRSLTSNDGGGLRLRVRPNGSRHWIYRYRLNKKEKNTSLGTSPANSHSRKPGREDKAFEARALVADGHDPISARQPRPCASGRLPPRLTLESVAKDWLEHEPNPVERPSPH